MWPVSEVLSEIDNLAPAFGVNPAFAKALALAENTADGKIKNLSWSGSAVSPKSARGIMQVMPATAEGLRQAGYLPESWKHDPTNLTSQIQAGLAAIKEMNTRIQNPNDPYELAAAYNAGPNGHKIYLSGNQAALPKETQLYFNKVRTALMDLNAPATGQPSSGMGLKPNVSTTRKVGNGDSLADLLSASFSVAGPGGTIDNAMTTVQGAADQRTAGYAALGDAILKVSQAAGDSAAAEAAVGAAAAARRAAILETAGLDPAAFDNRMAKAMDVINKTDEQLTPLKGEIDRRMSVGFFDNPLEWLVNQTRLPGLVAQYNAGVSTQNAAITNFKDAAALAKSQIDLSTGLDADLISKQGVAKASEAAARANAELAKIQVEASGASIREAISLAQLSAEKLNINARVFGLTSATETERQGANTKLTAEQEQQQLVEAVNKIIKSAGGAGITGAQFKAIPAATREALVQAASTGKYGSSLADAIMFTDSFGNLQSMAASGGLATAQWVSETKRAAMTAVEKEEKAWQATNPGKFWNDKQRQAAVQGQFESLQRIYEAEASNNMRNATAGNPYKLQYMTWAVDKDLANNPLAIWIKKYGPAGENVLPKEMDEKYILSRFAESVKTGSMTAPQAAAAISDFYKTAVQKQFLATSPGMYGLPVVKTYKVDIPKDGMFSSGSSVGGKIDLTNPSSVENYLTRQVSANAASALINFGNAFGMTR